jgi:septum formation topological specificity factor MinE
MGLKNLNSFYMFKNLFRYETFKNSKMTHKEALEIVMANYDRKESDKLNNTDSLQLEINYKIMLIH